jgi:solute carrier family 35 protein E3
MTARDRDAPLASPGGGSNQSRVLGDVTSFIANVSSSVLIVFVNKVLMDPRHGYGFSFATCLCALHFFTSALSVKLAQCLGFGQHASLPFKGEAGWQTEAIKCHW